MSKISQRKKALADAVQNVALAKAQLELAQAQLKQQKEKKELKDTERKILKAKFRAHIRDKKRQRKRQKLQTGKKVAVKVVLFFRFIPDEQKTFTRKSKKTFIPSHDDTYLLHAGMYDDIIMYENEFLTLKKLTYLGSSSFERVVDVVKQSDNIALMLDNANSQIEAIQLIPQGDATPVDVSDGYEANQPLASDEVSLTIRFPYLKNDNIFDVNPTPNLGEEQFKKNSCLVTRIIEKFHRDLKRLKKIDLTYELVWDICCPDKPYPEDDEYQLSLEQVVPFFRKYKLKLVAFDVFQNVVTLYDPCEEVNENGTHCKRNKKVGSSILCLLVHQRHAYALNHNLKALYQNVQHLTREYHERMHIGTHFFIREEEENAQIEVVLQTPKEIEQYIRNYKGNADYVKILTDYDIKDIMLAFTEKFGITASHLKIARAGTIKGFQVEQNAVIFNITKTMLDDSQPDLYFENEEEYLAYKEADNKVHRALFNKNNISHYSQQFREVVNTYTRGPIAGMFVDDPEFCKKPAPGDDNNKAYTARMIQLKYLPVGDEWCDFKHYEKGSTIKKYNIYLVKAENVTDPRDLIIFDKTHVLTTGFTLLEINPKCEYEILQVWEPIQLVPNPMKEVVKELWENPAVSMAKKKMMMNINIGCLDKRKNKMNRAEFFQDKAEAFAKQKKMINSVVMPIKVERESDTDGHELDKGVDIKSSRPIEEQVDEILNIKQLYLVIDSREKELEEGFLPISIFKSDLQRLEMWKMYGTLENAGLKVMGMNTDALFVAHNQDKALKEFELRNDKLFKTGDSFDCIGLWKHQNKRCNKRLIEQKENELIEFPISEPITIEYIDNEEEWKTNPAFLNGAVELLTKGGRLVFSPYPGSGKSHTTIETVKGKKHLIIHAFNSQREEMKKKYKVKVKTVHKLLGLACEGKQVKAPMDVTGIEFIVFDEIQLNNRRMLARIFQFMKNHPEIKFLATGDMHQITAIQHDLDMRSNAECLDIMFPHRLELQVIKRIKNEKDRQGYIDIHHAFFDLNWPTAKVFETYGHYFGTPVTSQNEIKTTNNLCFYNETRHRVNDHVFHNVLKKTVIKIGQRVVCKGYVKAIYYKNGVKSKKPKRPCLNRTYTVASLKDNNVTLKDSATQEKVFHVTRKDFDNQDFFSLPYCKTNHAAIGTTIDENITLFDWRGKGSDRNWVWTSITRVSMLEYIHLYVGPPLYKFDLVQEIKNKLQGHKAYDMKNGFYDEDNFLTVEWAFERLHKTRWICQERGCEMSQTPGNHQFSFDRKDDDHCHSKTNCRIICQSCNKGKQKANL
jgi:hypothetical protein